MWLACRGPSGIGELRPPWITLIAGVAGIGALWVSTASHYVYGVRARLESIALIVLVPAHCILLTLATVEPLVARR